MPASSGPQWDLLPEEARRALGNLTLRPRIKAQGRVSGLHPSSHQGQSLEFSDLKGYAFGDDPRGIDWKVLARTDKVYVRRFMDETNLTAYLVLDASGSMSYPEGLSKYAYASALLAGFAYVLLRQGDEVGLVVAREEPPPPCPPRGVPSHLQEIAETLTREPPAGSTVIIRALSELSGAVGKHGLVLLASDLLTGWEEALVLLRGLVSRGHAVVLLHVLSVEELTFPFQGSIVIRSVESGESALMDARGLRTHYLAAVGRFVDGVRRACAEAGIFHIPVDMRRRPHETVAEALRTLSGEG